MQGLNFKLLEADDIDCRVGSVSKNGYTLLLYKNARVDMQKLDETVGRFGWQRKHYELKDNLYCSVGIYDKESGQWIWKDDCGAESFSDKEKGEASDSFKRACVNWGIGRELYTAPFIFINAETEQNGKGGFKIVNYVSFKVNKIEYIASKISDLIISNAKTGEILYSMKGKSVCLDKKTDNKEEVKKEYKQTTLNNPGDFIFPFGKVKGKSIKQVYEEDKKSEEGKGYLDWCLNADFIKQDTKDLIAEFLNDVNTGYDPELEEVEIDSDMDSLPF